MMEFKMGKRLNKTPGSHITIKELASFCGVSIASVSNVLNGKKGELSPATEKKILQAIAYFHYKRNPTARALAGHPSPSVAFFASGNPAHPYQKGYLLALMDALYHAFSAQDIAFLLLPEQLHNLPYLSVEALLIEDPDPRRCGEIAQASYAPLILIDGKSEDFTLFQIYDDFPALFSQVQTRYRLKEFDFAWSPFLSPFLRDKVRLFPGVKTLYSWPTNASLLPEKRPLVVYGEETAAALKGQLQGREMIVLSYDPSSPFKKKIPLPIAEKAQAVLAALLSLRNGDQKALRDRPIARL